MPNNVVVSISAQDSATSVISGLSNTIEGATLKAQVLSQAIFTSLSSGLSAIGGKIKEASDIQLDAINAASTYSALTNRTFSDSTKVFALLNDQISKIATALPGSTEQYKQLASGIEASLLPAFVNAKGVLNEGDFVKGLTEITRGMGFLGAASQIAARDVANFTSKFLNGATIAELKSLSFAEKNPAFISLVERRLDATGKTLEQLTVKERAEILKAVQNKLINKDTIKAASESVSGLTESFKDKLFNPAIGVFGLLREIDKKTGEKQSVLSAFNDTLKALIGDGGLFETISKTLGLFGFKDDSIIRAFRDGILSFNAWINSLNKALGEVNKSLAKVAQSDRLNFLIKSISENLYKALDSISDLINQETINKLAVILANLFNQLNKAILSIDYEKLMTAIAKVLGELFIGLGTFLSNINWADFAKVLGVVLLGCVAVAGAIIVGSLLTSLGIIGAAIAAAVIGIAAVVAANWEYISPKIVEAWNFFWDGLLGIGKDLNDLAVKSGKFATDIFSAGWNSIISFGNLIKTQWDNLTEKITNIWNSTVESIFRFFDLIKNNFNNLTSKLGFSTPESAPQATQKPPVLGDMGFNMPVTNPNLINASSNRDLSSIQLNPSLVLANNSDSILNKNQQRTTTNRAFSVGSIVIHTQATNAKEISETVMSHLAQAFDDYASNNLSVATV